MKRKNGVVHGITLILAAALCCTAPAFASSEHGHGAPAGPSKTPEDTAKAIIDGNEAFIKHHDQNYFEPYQGGQVPAITVVSCSDSRVHTPLFGMDPHNNIFIIRNIGNQIRNGEGSVDYGVRHLPCRILLVMGHSSCGAVKAAMGDYFGETAGIKKELDTLKPVMAADDGKEPFNTRWGKNVERNVDYQVNYALKLYDEKVKAGEMAVVGAVYDFNGLYGKERGSLIVTNINGETDPNKIMRDPLLKELSNSEIVKHVGSLAPAVKW